MSILSVFAPTRLMRLAVSDAMNISRDPTLMFAILLSVVPSLGVTIWRNEINALGVSAFAVPEIVDYALPVILVLPAFLIGWVTGFLLLEDRDDGPLLALDVTPIGKSGFMVYRAFMTALVTAFVTMFAMTLLLPESTWLLRLLFAVLIAVEAVCAAFILPVVARNKVEGLAVTKLTNIASIIPLIAIFPSPWRYLAAIFPTYWIGEALQLSATPFLSLPLVWALAIFSHFAFAIILFALIDRRKG